MGEWGQKLLPQKMCFKTFASKNMINKKRFSQTSMNKMSFLQNALKYEDILQESKIFFIII